MKRRTFLQGGAIGVAGLSMTPALAHYESNGRHPTPEDLGASVTRLRKQFLEDFDAAYVDNVIVPHFLVSIYHGERPSLPMIDVTLSKENALPNDLWGMLSETWRPNPEQGVTVFLQALEKRGSRQSPQAHLHERGHAGSLPPHVQREGDAVFRQSCSTPRTPANR